MARARCIKAAAIVAALCLPLLTGGCGVVALGLVAYQMGKETDTHVQKCSTPNDQGEVVCHDTDKKGVIVH